jgi:acetyl esterase/lipase
MNENIQLWSDRPDVYLTCCSSQSSSGELKPAVIVCPGGGYMMTADSEAEPVAYKFADNGYKAYVLRYSTAKTGDSAFPIPLYDLAKAVLTLKKNSVEWGIDQKRIVVCGFSAGGHLAACLGAFWNSDFLKKKLELEGLINGPGLPDATALKPAALVLCYPVVDQTKSLKDWTITTPEGQTVDMRKVCNKATYGKAEPTMEDQQKISPINYVSGDTPPTFIWHTAQDDMVFAEGTLEYGLKLTKNKVPFEIHVFEEGPHALSLCDETTMRDKEHLNYTCRAWFGLALAWLERHKT